MGLIIGQTALQLANQGRGGVGDFAREATANKAREAARNLSGGGEVRRPGERRTQSVIESRAVTGPAAALRTLDRGVASARRIVPKVEDILDIARERFVESRAQRQAALREQQQEAAGRGASKLLPAASARVRQVFQPREVESPTRPEPAKPASPLLSRRATGLAAAASARPALLDVRA